MVPLSGMRNIREEFLFLELKKCSVLDILIRDIS